MIFSLCLVFITVILTGISQVLLKIGSKCGNENECFLAAYMNVNTLVAYGVLLVVTVISVIALMVIPLKLFYAIASLNFVVVLLLSWLLLKEKVNMKMLAGTVLIISGVLVFNLL